MKEILWRVPLSVTLQNGMSRRFTGPMRLLISWNTSGHATGSGTTARYATVVPHCPGS